MIVNVWTDGACKSNQSKNKAKAGVGVWFGPNDIRNVSEPLDGPLQTNNRAELTAMIRAIQEYHNSADYNQTDTLIVHTDSQYCKNGIQTWIHGWKKNSWKNSRKKPVKNKDLWVKLDKLREEESIQFMWVKAHSGIEGNEQADKLAVKGVNNRDEKYMTF